MIPPYFFTTKKMIDYLTYFLASTKSLHHCSLLTLFTFQKIERLGFSSPSRWASFFHFVKRVRLWVPPLVPQLALVSVPTKGCKSLIWHHPLPQNPGLLYPFVTSNPNSSPLLTLTNCDMYSTGSVHPGKASCYGGSHLIGQSGAWKARDATKNLRWKAEAGVDGHGWWHSKIMHLAMSMRAQKLLDDQGWQALDGWPVTTCLDVNE